MTATIRTNVKQSAALLDREIEKRLQVVGEVVRADMVKILSTPGRGSQASRDEAGRFIPGTEKPGPASLASHHTH